MGQMPDPALVTFERGKALTAAQLNDNFRACFGLAHSAITLALMPDQATVGLEMQLAAIESRTERLENMVAMHARQRNEKEWAPLSTLGAVLVRVTELQRTVEEATSRLLDAHAEIMDEQGNLGRRLARIEQRPEAASQEDHIHLVQEHARLSQLEKTLLAQVIALRAETGTAIKLATGHDRLANRLEWTPLSTTGHLLQRIMDIEKRLEAPT